MHYTYEDLRKKALMTEADEYGTNWVTVELEKGDTAFAPGTTKYHLRAHGKATVSYAFYREAVEAKVVGSIGRSLIDG